jgi:hypothetical protein
MATVAEMKASLAAKGVATGGAKAPAAGLPEFGEARDLPFWAEFRMNVLAAKGEGKTHLLLTGSAKPLERGAVLDDILLVETDSNGLAMIHEMDLHLPHVLNLAGLTDPEMDGMLLRIPKMIEEQLAAHPQIRMVGFDTASVLFGAVINTQLGLLSEKEGARAYNIFAKIMRDFNSALRRVKVPIVYTLHIKPPRVVINKKDGTPLDTEGIAASTGLDPGELPMDIEGNKAASVIRNNATLGCRIVIADLPGGVVQRKLDFYNAKVETKMRLTRCIGREEPADLSALFAKIAAGCGQSVPGATNPASAG